MSLEDAKARLRARISVNQPQLALSDNTALMAVAQSLLAEAEDIRSAVNAIAPTLFISQLTGAALAARAADFNVAVSLGTPATGMVTFLAPAPVSTSVNVPVGTVVTTAGDGITTIAQAFATAALATIPQGYSTSATNQQETITVTGGPTGGTFTLVHNGQTTAAITYSTTGATTASNIQAALQALSGVGASTITGQPNVAVTATDSTHYVVTWQYALGGLIWPVMTLGTNSLTGGTTPSLSSAITAAVTGTPVTATPDALAQYHAAANVAAGTITIIQTSVGNLSVTNATAYGGTATTGGADPDSNATIRANVYKVLQPKYGTAAIESAAIAAGAYDAYCLDPQNGSGSITLYYCDQFGNQPTALVTAVQAAIPTVLPPNLTVTYATFTIVNLTAVAVSVSAPAAVQTSTLTPAVQAAVAAYVQGNGTARSGLQHNTVPNGFAMGTAVQTGQNPQSQASTSVAPVVSLTQFQLTSTSPAIGAAANTTLYRLTGTPSTVISVTRV